MRRHRTIKPMRRCIACRKSRPQDELIRFVIKEQAPVVDISGRSEGRGFYLCRNEECIKTAVKRKAFNRMCKRNLEEKEISRLIGQLPVIYQGGIDVKES